MGFLRRLMGSSDRAEGDEGRDGGDNSGSGATVDHGALDEEERARELELALFDQERLDALARRQERYATRSWTPPAQGGERRADDADEAPR